MHNKISLTDIQVQVLINQFLEYKMKQGARSIIVQSLPVKGYWIGQEFYPHEQLKAHFNENYNKLHIDYLKKIQA